MKKGGSSGNRCERRILKRRLLPRPRPRVSEVKRRQATNPHQVHGLPGILATRMGNGRIERDMNDHKNKHIRAAVEYALSRGWRLVLAGGHAHVWGTL